MFVLGSAGLDNDVPHITILARCLQLGEERRGEERRPCQTILVCCLIFDRSGALSL